MVNIKKSILSSVLKKFLMAITGFVLASFLLIHMLGNLGFQADAFGMLCGALPYGVYACIGK